MLELVLGHLFNFLSQEGGANPKGGTSFLKFQPQYDTVFISSEHKL